MVAEQAGWARDRVAVVTGGAGGIGRAIARRFHAAGMRVVVGDVNVAAAERLLAEVDDPDGLRFVPADVAVEADVAALVGAAEEQFGWLDVMVNNAGVGGAYGPLTDIDVDDWDRTFGVISRGVFLGTKHAARVLVRQGRGGAIINMSSVAGLVGGGGPVAYSAAKAAVVSLTRNAAVELAEHRVRVNALCPGLIDTPLVMGRDRDAITAELGGFQPWPDLGRPEDIAGIALFLAGPDSAFVTGEEIRGDGGMLAWGPRMAHAHDQRGTTKRRTGFADGTTGRPGTRRRIGDAGD
jgi:NAD(P)-dependent dehydrogenase (short-subunit alcohol dehydrogenase family)